MNGWKGLIIKWIILGEVFTFGGNHLWGGQIDGIEKNLYKKRKELKVIRKELHLHKKKEKENQRREFSVLQDLRVLKKEQPRKDRELRKIEAKMRQIEENLIKTETNIFLLKNTIGQVEKRIILRWNALYKFLKDHTKIFFFNPSSYSDRLKLDKYYRTMIDSDINLIHVYLHQLTTAKREKEAMKHQQSEWLYLFSNLEREKEGLKKTEKKKNALLKSLQHRKAVYQEVIGELENKAKNLQAFIGKLGQSVRLLAHKKPNFGNIKGKLPWPVQGKVITFFKEEGRNGIEIRAPIGSKVQAVFSGKVIYADGFKGYGNIVIIDHGNNLFTVSAYCSKLLKRVGDHVFQGEPIACVGSERSTRESILYFEIRYRGKPQDPMEWVSKEEKEAR